MITEFFGDLVAVDEGVFFSADFRGFLSSVCGLVLRLFRISETDGFVVTDRVGAGAGGGGALEMSVEGAGMVGTFRNDGIDGGGRVLVGMLTFFVCV
jgi:hypothetical protein